MVSAVCGCAIGLRFGSSPFPPLILCLVFTLLAILFRARPASSWAVQAAVICLFWMRTAYTQTDITAAPELFTGGSDRAFVSVIGRVDDEAGVLREDEDGRRTWSFPLLVEGLHRVGDWRPVKFDVRVIWIAAGAAPPVNYGQRWQLDGLVRNDEFARGPSALVLRASTENARLLGEEQGSFLRAFCFRGRRACAEILSRGMEDFPDQAGLMRALMLGYRQAMPDHLYDIFSRTGTLHIVAISGSHIIIFSGIAIALIRSLGLRRTRWLYFLAPMLILYTLGTGMAPSADKPYLHKG